MDKQIKKLWLSALESGVYPKTKGCLNRTIDDGRPVGFCCLGVLLDLAAPIWKKDPNTTGRLMHPIGGTFGTVDYQTQEECGLSDKNITRLINLNDRSKTFRPVINYIKRYL